MTVTLMFLASRWVLGAALCVLPSVDVETDAALVAALTQSGTAPRTGGVNAPEALFAARSLEESARRVSTGDDLSLRVDYERAIVAYEEAIALFGRGVSVASRADFRALALSYIKLGAAQLALGRKAQASEAFRRAIAGDDTVEPDRRLHNPGTMLHWDAVKRGFAALPPSALTVAGDPAGADITLDGRPLGQLPRSFPNITAGEHWLVVRAPGHVPFSSLMPVPARGTARVDVFLRPSDQAERHRQFMAGKAEPSELTASCGSDDVVAVTRSGARFAGRVFWSAPGAWSTELWADSVGEIAERARQVSAADVQVALRPAELIPRAVHPLVALLPLGIGQFVERRPVVGALFLVAEIILLGLNLATAAIVLADRAPDGYYENVEQNRALRIVNISAATGLLLTLIGGGVDGLLHRAPATR